jgi:two-component system, cell cycle sensor histidine kinase and response regulator CckA
MIKEKDDLLVAWQELGARSKPSCLVYLPASLGLVCLTPELAGISWLLPFTLLYFALLTWWRFDSSRSLALAPLDAIERAKVQFDWSARTASLSLGILAAFTVYLADDWQRWLALLIVGVMVAAGAFSMAADFRIFLHFACSVTLPSIFALSIGRDQQSLVVGVSILTLGTMGVFVAWFNYRSYWDLLVKGRRQMEELASARERLEMVIQGSNLGAFDWLPLEKQLFFDKKIGGILGKPAEMFHPFTGSLEDLVCEEDFDLMRQTLTKVLQTQGTGLLELEARFPDADDQNRWFAFRGRVMARDHEGRARRIAGTYEHITAQKLSELELAGMREQMEQSEKLKTLGVLAGGVAHDFNNLLMAILGNLELAESELTDCQKASESLAQAKRAVVDASHLSDQLLAYAGKGQFTIELFCLNELVTEMSQLLRVSIGRELELALKLAPSLPLVKGDITQIRQVVLNLLTNASDSMEKKGHGTIEIRTIVKTYSEKEASVFQIAPGDYISLEIEDEGCGMDDETQKKVFDPFFTTKFTGRGLGLASVSGIARSHQGTIRVDSTLDVGTTFQFLLPAAEEAEILRAKELTLQPDSESMTVLVVDDEPSIRRLTARILKSAGHQSLEAEDGCDALEMLEEYHASIGMVLLDLTMPKKNGYETLLEIREKWPHMVVVLSSGYSADEVIQSAQADVQGFLKKPFGRDQLLSQISRLQVATHE